MANNIHSCLHWHIEMSVIVQIIFEAVTQIFSCHSFETAFIFTIISANFDAKFDLATYPENRDKIARLFLRYSRL